MSMRHPLANSFSDIVFCARWILVIKIAIKRNPTVPGAGGRSRAEPGTAITRDQQIPISPAGCGSWDRPPSGVFFGRFSGNHRKNAFSIVYRPGSGPPARRERFVGREANSRDNNPEFRRAPIAPICIGSVEFQYGTRIVNSDGPDGRFLKLVQKSPDLTYR